MARGCQRLAKLVNSKDGNRNNHVLFSRYQLYHCAKQSEPDNKVQYMNLLNMLSGKDRPSSSSK